ncbi:hypothetical protein BT63DRAFT_199516 [Microthyrium microscopicum]|uniref:Uncharacterized protein n=1 Tax=Microthyrium microscopicum TaxID=703497 RepID=A0A6A6UEG5_9PEZI|nr:hypothetical protein BT63DRAFT_199516 [Microthyrium microscopicum]
MAVSISQPHSSWAFGYTNSHDMLVERYCSRLSLTANEIQTLGINRSAPTILSNKRSVSRLHGSHDAANTGHNSCPYNGYFHGWRNGKNINNRKHHLNWFEFGNTQKQLYLTTIILLQYFTRLLVSSEMATPSGTQGERKPPKEDYDSVKIHNEFHRYIDLMKYCTNGIGLPDPGQIQPGGLKIVFMLYYTGVQALIDEFTETNSNWDREETPDKIFSYIRDLRRLKEDFNKEWEERVKDLYFNIERGNAKSFRNIVVFTHFLPWLKEPGAPKGKSDWMAWADATDRANDKDVERKMQDAFRSLNAWFIDESMTSKWSIPQQHAILALVDYRKSFSQQAIFGEKEAEQPVPAEQSASSPMRRRNSMGFPN